MLSGRLLARMSYTSAHAHSRLIGECVDDMCISPACHRYDLYVYMFCLVCEQTDVADLATVNEELILHYRCWLIWGEFF